VHSVAELRDRVRAKVGRRGWFLANHLMVVEQVDVRDDDGLNRKYAAMKVGDRLIPRHVLFSKKWVTKTPDVVTPELAAEEQRFIDDFPHADEVREIFRSAGIDYGRIDYGFSNGRLQVWEINSNPLIVPRPRRIDPLRLPAQTESAGRIVEALGALLREPVEGTGIRAFGALERTWWRAQAAASRRYDQYRR
jgi:hypothetical protein